MISKKWGEINNMIVAATGIGNFLTQGSAAYEKVVNLEESLKIDDTKSGYSFDVESDKQKNERVSR